MHFSENEISPLNGRFAVFDRMIAVRRLWMDREERGFLGVQFRQRLVKIGLRRGRHTETARTEINLIKIEREDVILAQRLLNPSREDDFLDLPFHRPV